jgi:hypothetical protein
MGTGLNALSHALALRLRDIARMLDRLDRLESGTGTWLDDQNSADLDAAALEMTLRALRVASDPINFSLLAYLTGHASSPVPDLQQVSGLDRLSLHPNL